MLGRSVLIALLSNGLLPTADAQDCRTGIPG
jgi:hypothetical protein